MLGYSKDYFGIIHDAKKFRYGKCDFPFDQMVDNTMYGIATGGMRLRFLTAASDATEKTEFRLMNSSKGSEAICGFWAIHRIMNRWKHP